MKTKAVPATIHSRRFDVLVWVRSCWIRYARTYNRDMFYFVAGMRSLCRTTAQQSKREWDTVANIVAQTKVQDNNEQKTKKKYT